MNVFKTNISTQDNSGLRAVADSQAPDLRPPGGVWGWGGVIAFVGGPRPGGLSLITVAGSRNLNLTCERKKEHPTR